MPIEEPLPTLTGERIDGFEVGPLLGRGGMGEVYRAFDTTLRREVALKIVRPALADDPGFVARFEREARAASAMSHPNLAHIYAAGNYRGRPYYVMELVSGESLAGLLKGERV